MLERMFTFTSSTEAPEARVRCKNCGWTAEGDRPADVFPQADVHGCLSGGTVEETRRALIDDGWRAGNDGLWRNDRFGGAYKLKNAAKRIGSQRGEET